MPVMPAQRPQHPPLAHDARGIPIAIPDGTIAWGIKRQTTGRPKVVFGPDRKPLRLPLDTTESDVLDLCGAGTFRLDAIDETGQLIDFVTTVSIGVECGGSDTDAETLPAMTTGSRVTGGGSELRFALEVTAHMARAQSDALRSIANAQADWIKGLASAKAIPRNGFFPAPPPPVVANADQDDDEDEDGGSDDADPSMTVLGHIASIAHDVSPVLQAMIPTKGEHRNAAPPPTTTVTPPLPVEPDVATPTIRIAAVLAELSPQARALACRVLARNDQRARDIASALQTLPIAEAVAQLEAAVAGKGDGARRTPREPSAASPVDPTAHLAAVMSRLAPDEIARARALLGTLDPERFASLKAQLLTMSPDDAAAFVRQTLVQHEGGGHAGA